MDHPFWAGNENKGQLRRIGFEATARLERHEFCVSWQDVIPGGVVVVGNQIDVMLDVEAVLLTELTMLSDGARSSTSPAIPASSRRRDMRRGIAHCCSPTAACCCPAMR